MRELDEFFYNGDMVSCYQEAKRQKNESYLNLLEKHLIHERELKDYNKGSEERPNEKYKEDERFNYIRSINNEDAFLKEMKLLEEDATGDDAAISALSYYTQGHLFLNAHHYSEAIYFFIQAAKLEPSNAVYLGIAGQTMQRLGYSPIEALGYIECAIHIDSLNARWFIVKTLLLLQLANELEVELFLENAIHAYERANQVIRPDQKSLKQALQAIEKEIGECVQNFMN